MPITASDWPIDPTTTSGTDLARRLNDLAGDVITKSGTLAGSDTFQVAPQWSGVPSAGPHLTNKTYVDAGVSSAYSKATNAESAAAAAQSAANAAQTTASGAASAAAAAQSTANTALANANAAGAAAASVSWTSVVGRPTNVSAFANDAGYLTGSSVPARGDIRSTVIGTLVGYFGAGATGTNAIIGQTVAGNTIMGVLLDGHVYSYNLSGTWRVDSFINGYMSFTRIS